MRKINYNRDKTKEKRNPFIEGMKEQGDDVCGAVLDSLNDDYLSYITNLVKAAKTPHKMRTQQPVDSIQSKNFKQKDKGKQLKKIPINIVNKTQSKQVSPKSPKSYNDPKNSTLPFKKMKEIGQQNEIGQIKRQRDKSASLVYQKKEDLNPLKIGKTFNLKQHYNRYPTQEAENIFHLSKNQATSLAYQSEETPSVATRKSKKSEPQKEFLENLDQYLNTLQSQRNFKKAEKRMSRKSNEDEEDLRALENIYQENIKLRKKIKKYEEKMLQIQQNMQNHFIHCKKQEKSYKTKINELTEVLFRAVQKVSQQKSEIEEMKSELKSFGRKAQDYVQKYENQSSEEQQDIHQSLLKAMRPNRTHSQYKMKRKRNILPFMETISKDQ